MSQAEISDYDDSNRAFLQAFLARNVLSFEEAKPILAAIFSVQEARDIQPDDVTIDDFNTYIATANTVLSPLDLEIRSTFHQQTRERYYALVNTTSDAMTHLATTYSADEIAFVKKLLDTMFDGPLNRGRKEAMCLSTIEAINVARNSRRDTQTGQSQSTQLNLSAREAESMVERLVEEGWLERSPKGFYSLSPRALMELKGWLVDTYNDENDDDEARVDKIKFCYACKEIVTMGQRCSQWECQCRLHEICALNFFRTQRMQNNPRCPVCRTLWDDHGYVGEKVITMSQNNQRGRRENATRSRLDNEEPEDEEAEV